MMLRQSREAVVTVRSYQNGILDGYLQHPRLEKKEKLKSVSQLVLLLGGLIDLEGSWSTPMSFVTREHLNAEDAAVFKIQIMFREHYTWQGRLIWQDEETETVFDSCLELMQLIDEILAE